MKTLVSQRQVFRDSSKGYDARIGIRKFGVGSPEVLSNSEFSNDGFRYGHRHRETKNDKIKEVIKLGCEDFGEYFFSWLV